MRVNVERYTDGYSCSPLNKGLGASSEAPFFWNTVGINHTDLGLFPLG